MSLPLLKPPSMDGGKPEARPWPPAPAPESVVGVKLGDDDYFGKLDEQLPCLQRDTSAVSLGDTNETQWSDGSTTIAEQGHPDIRILYDQTLEEEHHHSFTADNALGLHLDQCDDPFISASLPSTRGEATIEQSKNQNRYQHETLRTARVRFRSRVRIGSGIPRGHPQCSADSSPSSSFSAPLRGHRDDPPEVDYTLNTDMLKTDSLTEAWVRKELQRRAKREMRRSRGERTPLNGSQHRVSYVRIGNVYCDINQLAGPNKTEEDVVFGPWPRRLLNRRWWWWKIESVACYCCADDSEDEDQI